MTLGQSTTLAELAIAARFELQAREKHWPLRVAAGDMTQAEADADITAWRAIASLFATGTVDLSPVPSPVEGFADLVAAAQAAIDSRSTKPTTPANEARIAALVAIRAALIRSAHAAGTFAWRHDAAPQDCRGAVREAA